MMAENMKFDETIGKWRVGYPFLQDPKVLRDNYKTVLRMAETLERRLDKAGIVEPANEVFHKMVSNGALVELDQREMVMWDGAQHKRGMSASQGLCNQCVGLVVEYLVIINQDASSSRSEC